MRQAVLVDLLLIAFLLAAVLDPVPAGAARVHLGPAFAVNQASLGGDVPPEHHYEGITSLGAGMVFDYYLRDDVAISFQPGWIEKGADLVWKRGEQELARTELRAEYLSLPFALKITGSGRSCLYALGGVQLDLLLDATRRSEGSSEDFTEGFEEIELATSFAVGGRIALGANFVFVEGRYTQGFTNIAVKNLLRDSDTASVKTAGVQLIVGYLLELGP